MRRSSRPARRWWSPPPVKTAPCRRWPRIAQPAGRDGQVDLPALLRTGRRGVNEVLVEAGAGLVGAFARQGLVDEFQIFVAGKFLGSAARPLLDWPLAQMSDAPRLKITEMRAVGDDWRVTAIPLPAPGV
jgi:diaminohydroxyphosphoribosylaminopyrimidine deaminase/5-amino-6-(5-phosphoribosylamino)uracil reductase